MPSKRAKASVTLVAFKVQTNGRKRPVASANPATAPVGSAVGRSATAYTVPDVPIEMTTSPGCSPSPRAAAMLSPVPGPISTSPWSRPIGAAVGQRPGRLGGGQHRRQGLDPVLLAVDDPQQVEPPPSLRRGPVARAGCVPAVGDESIRQPPREPVVR